MERYRGKLRFFQIWNEPNYGHEWNWGDPNPGQFLELLKIGYTQAKAANPESVILFPSLTPADGLDWQAMSDLTFLDQIYALGGSAYFDIFTAQQYGLGQPPSENRYVRPVYNANGQIRRDTLLTRPLDSRADITRVVLLREIMERYGDVNKAVWISEFGWNSNPGDVVQSPFGPPVSEDQKAVYLVDLMKRARREWPWMGVMNVWFLRAGAGFNPPDPTIDFQLVREDWTPLPAYNALSTYLNGVPVIGPGSYAPTHPAIAQAPNGETIVQFWGDRIEVYGMDSGTIQVDDSQPVSAQLSSGKLEVGGLDLKLHTARLKHGKPTMIKIFRTDSGRIISTIIPFIWLLVFIFVLYRGLEALVIQKSKIV